MNQEPTPTQRILEVAKTYNLTMELNFIPWSKSRDAHLKDPSLNWKVTLSNKHRQMTIDYTMGHGHCKSRLVPGKRTLLINWSAIKNECEDGKARRAEAVCPGTMHPGPKLEDVLACLAADATVLDYPSFEEWALDFGYDSDSRKAEKIYHDCLEQALKLRSILGEKGLSELVDAAQNY